jgi:hypothetical protein
LAGKEARIRLRTGGATAGLIVLLSGLLAGLLSGLLTGAVARAPAGFAAKPPAPSRVIHLNGIVIDKYCADIAIASHDGLLPVVHQKACILLEKPCIQSGLGIIQGDRFYAFSPAANQRMITAVRRSKRADDLTIAVTGNWNGRTLSVTSYHWR